MRILWQVWGAICFACFLGTVAVILHALGWTAALKFFVIIFGGGLVLCAIGLLIFYAPMIIGLILGFLWVGIVETAKTVFRKLTQLVRP